ncbi:unnamed protein product [Leptosia nina]|uniref:DUF3752 domain-containing protein n=1 Tax=Leptosia nina TaxID=320188 RepID=A0AAV1JGH7_9NEOP
MLSDESSSDSETGRFKCQTKQDEKKPSRREENRASNRPGRSRPTDEKYERSFDRRRDDRNKFDRQRDKQRYNRYSPIRSRRSRDRSKDKRSRENYKVSREGRDKLKIKDHSLNREQRTSRSRSSRSPFVGRSTKNEEKDVSSHLAKSAAYTRRPRSESPPSQHSVKKSEVYKPIHEKSKSRKSGSPVVVIEDNDSPDEVVQPGSYYSMIPALVKEKSIESSEIDSSDDEKLRAKLLNLEKELHKSKRKKHKKKHKKRSSKSKEKSLDSSAANVEVTSTTDIQEVQNEQNTQSTEVSSTQKNRKDSSEEGEILSDEEEYDPTDLRHKLKRSKNQSQEPPKLDACGPALPPHLQKHYKKSVSPDITVNSLKSDNSRKIGPSIPSDMRKVLAERSPEVIKDESSEEDSGIGPLPAGAEAKWSQAHQKLEERAYEMKIKHLEGHNLQEKDIKSREKWMLELPEGKTKFLGLEARGFRARAGPDMSDRSSWTDTPEEKARKAAGVVKEEDASVVLQREAREKYISNRDEEQEQAVKKHKKKHKREESLLEMHQKKLKKKKKKEIEEKKERRPFSRDVDLQVNRFDEAQKKSIIKKAQDLNTRFSRGDAKYL